MTWLADLLRPDVSLRHVSEGIWSVLPVESPGQRYDRRAAAYDRVVGNRLYNRLLWGSSPASYAAFAHRALTAARGPYLDAGCGSLVFTVEAYTRSSRPVVLLDQSIGMLETARDRLLEHLGALPESVVLVQADLRDLPFRAGAFSTVLSMGMLHLFDRLEPILDELVRVTEARGGTYLTSLVSDRPLGRGYLRLLCRAGEVAEPRTYSGLLARVGRVLGEPIESVREGNMAFLVAHPTGGVVDGSPARYPIRNRSVEEMKR